MRCPKCRDKVESLKAGEVALDWLLACVGCSWQVFRYQYAAWKEKWT